MPFFGAIAKALVGGGGEKMVGAVFDGIDALVTSDEEKQSLELLRTQIQQNPAKWQVLTNMAEAKHRSVFVAGWRPFIGWICGGAVAWHYIAGPIVAWYMAINAPGIEPPPSLDVGDLMTLIFALLGMAGLRSYEKREKLTT